MRKRYLAIIVAGVFIVLFSLFQMGLTVVLNRSNSEILIAVANESEKTDLVKVLGTFFVGFPQIEGSYVITCRRSNRYKRIGYTTKLGFNRMIVRQKDISC
jgi:hypothetical protein